MRKDIRTYLISIADDNANFIIEAGYQSIAEYIINTSIWNGQAHEFFDDAELEDNNYEPTAEQIAELENYLKENFNYLPEVEVWKEF